MIQAVLFDLDGLMFDSEPHSLGSWEAVLREREVALDEATISRVLGLRTVDTAKTLIDAYGLPYSAEAHSNRSATPTASPTGAGIRDRSAPVAP